MHAGSGSDTPIGIEASARLDALGERWMTTPATITYRTTQRKPGEASLRISAFVSWSETRSVVTAVSRAV